MKVQLRKLWRVLLILLCIGGVLEIRGGRSYAVGDVTESSDATSGQYKMWFIASMSDGSDVDFTDTNGMGEVQWNMKVPATTGFVLPNTGIVTARLSIAGDVPADLSNVVDKIRWTYSVTGASGRETEIMAINSAINISSPLYTGPFFSADGNEFIGTGEATELSLLIQPKTAGLVSVNFIIEGYRNNESEPVITVNRTMVIGSPLQIYSYPQTQPRTYTDFSKESDSKVTIFANNKADLEACQIYWFFVDAKGNYTPVSPAHIALQNLGSFSDGIADDVMLTQSSQIVKVPTAIGAVSGSDRPAGVNVPIWSYELEAKETGGFTRMVGRIYQGGDSRSDKYVECFYDVVNAAKFRESQYTIDPDSKIKILQLNYGDTKRYSVLANDTNNSLGWTSYDSYTDVLTGIEEDSVVVIGSDGITAQNYGYVTLEATALYKDWECFNSVGNIVTDTLDVFVAADILKGNTFKSIVDKTEVISVGGTIPLSTNVVNRAGNQYAYKWEYLLEGGVETGSGTEVAKSWQALMPSVNDTRFSIIESTAGSDGLTSLTIQGKSSGQVRIRCTVIDKKTGQEVLEEEKKTFTLKIVDTMTLSDTRKAIAVGGTFDIEAFISGMAPGAEVEWEVVDSVYADRITISKIGLTTATVTGVEATDGRYVECRASVEIDGTTKSATFYVMVVPPMEGIRIEASPSRVISVGGSARLDLIIDSNITTSFTKDQVKWVLKDFVTSSGLIVDADSIIRKEDNENNIFQSTVTGLSIGEAYVAVVTNDSVQTEIAILTIKVVSEVQGLRLNKEAYTLYLPSENHEEQDRNTFQLVATPLPEGYTDSDIGIEWSVPLGNDTVMITPDPRNPLQALVTANQVGSVRVTANVSGLPDVAAFCDFTVENAVEGIALDPPGSYELRVGETQKITPILTPENVTDSSVIWEIQNETIAAISQDGVLTAVSPGTTVLTCTTSNGLSVQYPVIVFNPVDRIDLSEIRKKIEVGGSFDMEAYLTSSSTGAKVKWSVVDSEYQNHIAIESIGDTKARITGLASTEGNYVACKATVEVGEMVTSATFYVEVVSAINGAKIKASPSSVISVGDTVQLDLIFDTVGTSYTKDQIKWIVKGVEGQGDPKTIIEKKDSSNLFQTTIKGLSIGEAYVAAVINDSVQTEIAIVTIKVVPNVKAIELNQHEVKGNPSDSIVLTATPYPEEYAGIENLKIEWICFPENGTITITPDPNHPYQAVATLNKTGIVCVMAKVSDMPQITDFCMFEVFASRPSYNDNNDNDNDDNDNDNNEGNSTTNNNTSSGSDLTSSEQNRVEAALGSSIVIQAVVKGNAGKLVVTVGHDVVFCEKDGTLAKDKWQSVDGVWYYFGSDSKAVDGWLKTKDQWYYMNQNNKHMETGWMKTADGKWYLLDERNGDMKTGWQQRNGKWYLLDGINGDMKTDWQLKDGKWYLLDGINGDMKIGWQQKNGKWYYLTESGAMAANTITPDGYQVDYSGVWIP